MVLDNRQEYVVFGEQCPNKFRIFSGLLQSSSLSPYLFIVFHSELTTVLGVHSVHLFADDRNILIRLPTSKNFAPMIEYLERESTKVCNWVSVYSRKWEQPINVSKVVAQIFFSQATISQITIPMDGYTIEVVKSFQYLGRTWTSKPSL